MAGAYFNILMSCVGVRGGAALLRARRVLLRLLPQSVNQITSLSCNYFVWCDQGTEAGLAPWGSRKNFHCVVLQYCCIVTALVCVCECVCVVVCVWLCVCLHVSLWVALIRSSARWRRREGRREGSEKPGASSSPTRSLSLRRGRLLLLKDWWAKMWGNIPTQHLLVQVSLL